MREIFLHFCTTCGTVVASQNRVTTEPTLQRHCEVCREERTFAPVAVDLRARRFLTIE